jgi:hypothetical protein
MFINKSIILYFIYGVKQNRHFKKNKLIRNIEWKRAFAVVNK